MNEIIFNESTKDRVNKLNNKIENLDTIVEPYLDKKLYASSDTRQSLVDDVSPTSITGISRKWTTVKKWLLALGYSVSTGRDKRGTYYVINK